jgi:hypothetical protein
MGALEQANATRRPPARHITEAYAHIKSINWPSTAPARDNGGNMKQLLIAPLLILFAATAADAACTIQTSSHGPVSPQGDAFYQLASRLGGCAANVQQLKAQLHASGAKVEPAMVANRGFNNPALGSFSFFETVSGSMPAIGFSVAKGEFFFGHFTAADAHQLFLDHAPGAGKLMVELMAWDRNKRLFNFYELIGQGTTAQWFYRGDSADILHDNAKIYRGSPGGPPKFGTTLRCSGCHSSGGPIMKDLALPHNDWWTASRPLPLGTNAPTSETLAILRGLTDADSFSQNVTRGILEIENSSAYQSARASLSLQEKLRPLFCENEINLESSLAPSGSSAPVQIPSGFFVNPLLGTATITVAASTYLSFVQRHGLHFPETPFADADHAWLTPVKGFSDLLAIQTLVKNGVIDLGFARAVLAIDADHPVFSPARCGLLKLVPPEQAGWRSELVARLQTSGLPLATDLLRLLAAPPTSMSIANQPVTDEDFQKLLSVRQAAFASEISQNPRGQILEPGFRVIFPTQRDAHRF